MLTSRNILSSAACLILLAAAVHGQCTLPTSWTTNPYNTQLGQLWRLDPETQTQMMMFSKSNGQYMVVTSGVKFTCLGVRTDPNGFTMVLFQSAVDTTNKMCIYGQTPTAGKQSKVLFYKKSAELQAVAASKVGDCDGQAGIANTKTYLIMTRQVVDPTHWVYNLPFGNIPDNEYLFAYGMGIPVVQGCTKDPQSKLTMSGGQTTMSVSSGCVTVATNPFSKVLKIVDFISDKKLGLGTTDKSGFLVVGQFDAAVYYPTRFYVVKYKIDTDGSFYMHLETDTTGSIHLKGYFGKTRMSPMQAQVNLKTVTCLKTPPYCQNNGVCLPGFTTATCQCTPDYEDNICSTPVNFCLPSPCLNNGACAPVTTAMKFACTCAPGFTGETCQLTDKCVGANAVVCQNNGVCGTFKSVAGIDTGYCKCVAPSSGARCEKFDPCAAKPCQNGGVCFKKEAAAGVNDFRCQCAAGFFGNKCESVGPGPCGPKPCLNGGMCEVVGTGYKCTCATGYTGTTCADGTSKCTTNPCKNGGECQSVGDGVYCSCPNVYQGAFCEEYEDWFIILLVMVILTVIIIIIITLICSCYCCCGWRPGSKKTAYESYMDTTQPSYQYPTLPTDPMPETFQFNFVPPNEYIHMTTT